MRRALKRLFPERIAVQLFVIMLIAIVTLAAIFSLSFYVVKPELIDRKVVLSVLRYVSAVTLLNEAQPEDRAKLLDQLISDNPQMLLVVVEEVPPLKEHRGPIHPNFLAEGALSEGLEILAWHPADQVTDGSPDEVRQAAKVYFQLRDGTIICALVIGEAIPPVFGGPLSLLMGFLVLSLLFLLSWGGWILVRPLSELSQAVACYGENSAEPVPIKETGPREIRDVAKAFNQMQQRIQELIDRRTQILAAVGHDLRTPLTRLRLRLDLLTDEDQKQRNLADLELMETQLNGALTFLREGHSPEPVARIDLCSLLRSVVDQYDDLGTPVRLECPGKLTVNGRSSQLIRAVSNLVDNAFRYNDQIDIAVRSHDGFAEVDVIDHGPGIPEADKERLIKPFERGDAARRVNRGVSFGLGLATVKTIAAAHHGDFKLLETPGGGLTARILLPEV